MESLNLVKPDKNFVEEIRSYKKEFLDAASVLHGAMGLKDYDDPLDWIEYCRLMENRETLPGKDRVESDEYMLIREKDKKLLGLINFRHYLEGHLIEHGGHIGFSVRPSERRKGYATEMLNLCLKKCREKGLVKVLITCNVNNEASRRTIIGCGGVYERTTHVETEGVDFERYWIALTSVTA
jgi:predicted acetyltransferase